MSPPQHICPKCKGIRPANLFTNDQGKPTKWCAYCRLNYRGRLTSLHQRDATKPKREEANDATSVATREGYANHPLATLLALSHIAGAKRALAIRDGNSWRGKKAWRAYYEAKRALEAELAPKPLGITFTLPLLPEGWEWRVYGGDPDRPIFSPSLTKLVNDQIKRDPNSSGVS